MPHVLNATRFREFALRLPMALLVVLSFFACCVLGHAQSGPTWHQLAQTKLEPNTIRDGAPLCLAYSMTTQRQNPRRQY